MKASAIVPKKEQVNYSLEKEINTDVKPLVKIEEVKKAKLNITTDRIKEKISIFFN